MNTTWVFCCGMRRAASTLQYHVAEHLVTHAGRGIGVGWVTWQEFDALYERLDGQQEMVCLKCHPYLPDYSARAAKVLTEGRLKALYSQRDLRDVVVSLRRMQPIIGHDDDLETELPTILATRAKWLAVPSVYVSEYENIVIDLAGEIRGIAAYLDIPISDKGLRQIARLYSLDSQRRRQPTQDWDTKTMLWPQHIGTGLCGQWRKRLTAAELVTIARLEERFGMAHSSFYPVDEGSLEGCQIPGLAYIYERYLGRKSDGVFVDVGAFNGLHWSNTRCFALLGWRGLLVEPAPEPLAELNRLYWEVPNITIAAAAVGRYNNGRVTLYLGGSASTIRPETVALYADIPELASTGLGDGKTVEVPLVTLDFLLYQNKWPARYDVLSLDVEGSELDALAGYDIDAYRPTLAIVETHERFHDERLAAKAGPISTWFDERGYEKVYADQINSIYVDKTR